MTSPGGLHENLVCVRARIAAAARRAGRDPDAVRLVVVTKTAGADTVLALLRAGHLDFGENRPLDLAAKRAVVERAAAADAELRGRVPRWHAIGHFQRNKARRTLAAADEVHSVDSVALAEILDAEAERLGRSLPVHVQVNVSGEGTKGGFAPAALEPALARLRDLASLRVEGLMTMAPWSDDPETSRPVFRRLRELRDWASASGYLRTSGLSMGMTDDFEIAVEEGATTVRVGRAVVGATPGAGGLGAHGTTGA